MDDFYTDRLGLAGYFEKEWFDHVAAQADLRATLFKFVGFDPSHLYCDSHERVADFVASTLQGIGVKPTRLLEIGPGLGRGLYEHYKRLPSLQSATLVEPSQNLAHAFESLFKNEGLHTYPVLRGNVELIDVPFNSIRLREDVRGLEISLINTSHDELGDLGVFDLVCCFNVLDNSRNPLNLVARLQRSTTRGGIVSISCTYQWNDKFLDDPQTGSRDIRELFDDGWSLLNETTSSSSSGDVNASGGCSSATSWCFVGLRLLSRHEPTPPVAATLHKISAADSKSRGL